MSHPGFPGAGAGCHDAALALVEVASIARGMRVGDAMVKRAACRVLLGEPVTPGKFLVLVSGPVDVVEESFQAGVAEAGDLLLAQLFLPGVHPQVVPAIQGTSWELPWDSLGVVETRTVSAGIVAADVACKESPVQIIEMRLAAGVGGKGVFTLTGDLSDVQAAVEAAAASARGSSALVQTEVIARPHPDFRGRLWAR